MGKLPYPPTGQFAALPRLEDCPGQFEGLAFGVEALGYYIYIYTYGNTMCDVSLAVPRTL